MTNNEYSLETVLTKLCKYAVSLEMSSSSMYTGNYLELYKHLTLTWNSAKEFRDILPEMNKQAHFLKNEMINSNIDNKCI